MKQESSSQMPVTFILKRKTLLIKKSNDYNDKIIYSILLAKQNVYLVMLHTPLL